MSESENGIKSEIEIPEEPDPHQQRLYAALFAAQGRLLALQEKSTSSSESVPNFEAASRYYLKACKHAKDDKTTLMAWDCLHQFDDVLIGEMSAEELKAYWCTLSTETEEKLNGWRAKDRARLVTSMVDGADVSTTVVRQLHSHLATTAQNLYLKIEVFEKQTLPSLVRYLRLVIISAVVGALIVISMRDRTLEYHSWAIALLLAIGAGGLGGLLSMTISLARIDLSEKIPATRLAGPAMMIRPFLGAVVAIPILVFIKTGFVAVKGIEGNLAIFAFCFLGGISERWFIDLLGRFESATGSANKKDTEGQPSVGESARPRVPEKSLGEGANRVSQQDEARTEVPARK